MMMTANMLIPLQEHGLDSSSPLDHGLNFSLVLGFNGFPNCPAQRKSFYAGACLARAFLFFLSLARLLKISSIPILPLFSSLKSFHIRLPDFSHFPHFRLVIPKIFFPRGGECHGARVPYPVSRVPAPVPYTLT